jgi:hypothetical protein
MRYTDSFSKGYAELLDGVYDCVDRIVLNGFFIFGQSPGGFRSWWRLMFGSDDNLDNAHLMRLAGRFSRRLRTAAKKNNIPVIKITKDDRAHQLVEPYRPTDPRKRGVFCITVHRAPNSVWEVEEYGNGGKNLKRKDPKPYVNHYAFHIHDPEWGHVTIKVCGHAPFNVQVSLNGHEYVARQAAKRKIPFTKEGNCFTETPDLAGLSRVAETIRSKRAIGRLKQVCEHWVYTACLCYVLNLADQQRTDFRYCWSLYQAEYSRNLMFHSGRAMEEIFQTAIDRTRRALDVKTIRTLFGRKRRPFKKKPRAPEPRLEVVIERPTYDLTVFKIHFGLLTLKMYTKGGRVLRIEAIVHNARKEFDRGYGVDKFPQIVTALRSMAQRFLEVVRSIDSAWVTDNTWESLPEPSQLGRSRVAGLNLNQPRIRAVMQAVIALSALPRGFRAQQVAANVREITGAPYTPRQASYDLKKLRAKSLVQRIDKTQRYHSSPEALRTMAALSLLRDKVIKPILTNTRNANPRQKANALSLLDQHYEAIQHELQQLFHALGIAA